jgi:hypothetical protein
VDGVVAVHRIAAGEVAEAEEQGDVVAETSAELRGVGAGARPSAGISIPALVSSPIFTRSRRLSCAAMLSHLFLAASRTSFSLRLFLFEMSAIKGVGHADRAVVHVSGCKWQPLRVMAVW